MILLILFAPKINVSLGHALKFQDRMSPFKSKGEWKRQLGVCTSEELLFGSPRVMAETLGKADQGSECVLGMCALHECLASPAQLPPLPTASARQLSPGLLGACLSMGEAKAAPACGSSLSASGKSSSSYKCNAPCTWLCKGVLPHF